MSEPGYLRQPKGEVLDEGRIVSWSDDPEIGIRLDHLPRDEQGREYEPGEMLLFPDRETMTWKAIRPPDESAEHEIGRGLAGAAQVARVTLTA